MYTSVWKLNYVKDVIRGELITCKTWACLEKPLCIQSSLRWIFIEYDLGDWGWKFSDVPFHK